jgi:hypothetical protein
MDIIHQLTSIFCEIDDFCKEIDKYCQHKLLPIEYSTMRGPKCGLTVSEIMTILIMFQMIGYRNFKTFYCGYLTAYWRQYFPELPSYNRFIELTRRAIFPLVIFTQLKSGKRTGIYYIDGSCLPVCHLKRQHMHKTFKEIAKFGRTSVGWFFGVKLHLVINNFGQLIAFKITRGNRADSQEAYSLLKTLKGFAFGDKGYIGKSLFEELLKNGLKLITRKRKNMKAEKLSHSEQQLLNQRGLIETVIGYLKCHYQVWHTRHRSIINAFTHLMAALAAYVIEPLKLSAIKLLSGETVAQLAL